MLQDPVPRSLVAVDIEGYSRRSNLGHLELRKALRDVCDEAFRRIQVAPEIRQDQGDAFLILIRPEVTKPRLIDDLIRELDIALRRFNQPRMSHERMRLRVALHSGEIHPDGAGFAGESIVTVMRLLDADVLRRALTTTPGSLAVIVSDSLYRDVVTQAYRDVEPTEYQCVEVSNKTFQQRAWIRLPGQRHHTPPTDHDDTRPAASGGFHFSGPTSFGGHAAGRDVNVQGPQRRLDG
jgi:hypothetical protein